MHFAHTVGSYICMWLSQRVMREIFLALPLLRCSEGPLGHLQPRHDLCVCWGLVRQQMPSPLPAYHPTVCEHISAGGVEGRGVSDTQRGEELLWNAAGSTTHTASNAINQATGISLISFWGGQPENLHKQSWPRKLASFMWPSGFSEQVPLLCCLQCQFHFYS